MGDNRQQVPRNVSMPCFPWNKRPPKTKKRKTKKPSTNQTRLESLLDHNSSWPATVVEVDVQGSGLNDYTIRKTIQPLLEPTTLGELLQRLDKTARRFKAFKIHDDISYSLDSVEESQMQQYFDNIESLQNAATAAAVDRETLLLKTRLQLAALPKFSYRGTQIASSMEDGSLTLSYGLRDLMGLGDIWTGAASWVNNPFQHGKTTAAVADIPVLANPFRRLTIAANSQSMSTTDSPLHENKNGLTLGLAQFCHCNTIAKVALDLEHRNLASLSKEDKGSSASTDSTKVALSGQWSMDTRSPQHFPAKGMFTRFLVEGAGSSVKLPGNASYLRALFDFNAGRNLFSDWVNINISAKAGYMNLANGTVSDKFFLGSALPGFQYNGVGPRSPGNVALGGDSFTFGNASVFTKIPYLSHTPLRTHFYLSGASLVSGAQPEFIMDRPAAASVGVGLSYRASSAQVECSYAVPVKAGTTDIVRPGIRLGVSLAL